MLLQYLEARNKGRLVSTPSRDSRQGLDVAYLSALTTSAKLAEEEQRIKNHFLSQTMSLKVTAKRRNHGKECCHCHAAGPAACLCAESWQRMARDLTVC